MSHICDLMQKIGVIIFYTAYSVAIICTKKKNDLATLRVSGNSNSVILTIKTLWEIHGTLSVYQNQLRISCSDGSNYGRNVIYLQWL